MKSNFKIAIRNAFRNGTLSFAKLFGMSISFAVVLFAAGYAFYETSYDKCVPDHDRIYRCLMEGRLNNEDASFAVTSPEEAKAISSGISEITEAIRILSRGDASIEYDRKIIQCGQFLYADPEFFSFFNIPVRTNYANPLASQNNLIIAKSLAQKHFGSVEAALNKTVKQDNEDCIITGVFDDLPKNFHLQPKLIQSLKKSNPDSVGWESQNYYTYFKTRSPVSNLDELNFKISKIVYTHYDSDGKIDGSKAKSWEDLKYAPDVYIFYNAEPLTKIHFSVHKFDPAITSNKVYVYGAVVLSILILLISSINFTNLTIANISTRLRDVGIRKTTGARNFHITKQFLFESLIFLLVSFILALFIYQLTENHLLKYVSFDIELSNKEFIKVLAIVLAVLLLFNTLAILVPIVFISKKRILNLIKEEKKAGGWYNLNNSLVFFQFVLSGLIILCAFLVNKQINYMVNKDRGYDIRNVMMLVMWEMHPETRRSFIEELKTYNAIESVSTADVYFGEDFSMNAAWFDSYSEENYFHTSVLPADDRFLSTFNIKIKEGRYFEKDKQTDSDAAILNETALKEYSGKGSMIDKNLIVGNRKYTVIGIVKDFNFRSLHYPIQPLVITRIDNFGNVFIKVKNDQIKAADNILRKLWEKYKISSPLEYQFHDQVVLEHYLKDQQAKRLLFILSVISVIIACVGLYAISFFRIVRRTKEIGIRKVNGANVAELMSMLNIDFLKWVIIAFIISCPIAWLAMHKWLQNFAYKTELSWWIFIAAGTLAIAVALITVSWQSWKAATRNPVEALRYE